MPSLMDGLTRLWPKRGPLATATGQRLALGVIVIIFASVALAVRTVPIGLQEGAPAPRTFRATRALQYVDEEATEAQRKLAVEGVGPVYVFDAQAQNRVRNDIVELFASIASLRREHSDDATAQADALTAAYAGRFGTEAVEALQTLSDEDLQGVARNVEALVGGIMSSRVLDTEVEAARSRLAQSADLIPLSLMQRFLVITIGNEFIEPTLLVDDTATESAREAARENVVPVVVLVQEGENIVDKGEIVTARDIEMVRTLGGLEHGADVVRLISAMVLLAVAVAASGGYIVRYEEESWHRFRDLLIVACLFLGMMYLTRLTTILAPEVSPYLMPVAAAPMVATLLLNARMGLVLTFLTTTAGILLGFVTGATVVAVLVVSLASIVAMRSISQRSHLFYAGAFVVTATGILAFGANLAQGAELRSAFTAGGYGSLGGLLAAVLTYGLLPFFEHVFGVTTDVRLLELANPGHPLLRRLMTEAPGTYSHSIMTGNLAETAAEAIGANPLLARVGAYFHDVGKIRRPGFFVENQGGATNPHDNTSPTLSALIITAHVREGLELAEEYKLPEEVVDVIKQHHGNSLVSYFYNKASEADSRALEADFRYGGERPKTPEAAIVMLADSVEAAVRSLKNPTLPRVEHIVRSIVDGKRADGQLDEADLTLADIERITQVYARMLVSVYHPRIEYPETTEAALTRAMRKERNAGKRQQPSRS